MRILKGYSDDEQKELENAKKHIDCNDLLHIITDFISGTRFDLIWSKYNEAEPDEQISIIRDILDYYAGVAKFAEPKKYYIHLIKGDKYSYLTITPDGVLGLGNRLEIGSWTKFTRDEVVAIDPRLVPFMEEVEDDE